MVLYYTPDPIFLSLGPLEIRYYGLMYAISFVIVYLTLKWFVKKKQLNCETKDVDTFMTTMVVSMLFFARLFYVVFYNFSFYLENPLKMIAIWEGGLSFHGGLLGVAIAAIWFAKRQKISPLLLGDILVIPLPLCLALGRLGNWINGELYGRITDVSWGVNFAGETDNTGNPIFRHPSQIYEMIKNILIFLILFPLKNKNFPQGTLFSLFLMLYAIFRFVIEFYRQPELYVGFLTMGQFLNVFAFLAGLGVFIYARRKK